jgi:MoxR-like ATPase
MSTDPAASTTPATDDDLQAIKRLKEAYDKIMAEMRKAIVGQEDVIRELLISIFARGHCLLDRRAGAGQDAHDSHAGRRAEPGLQPHPVHARPDAVGHHRHRGHPGGPQSTGERVFKFLNGPIFANVILADEINRTPPKTQAALLEAMQEKQVTVGGTMHHPMPKPFFVLATQNPIEQEGTYPLPEAQQDRFMFKLFVDYPSYDEEYKIAEVTTAHWDPSVDHA